MLADIGRLADLEGRLRAAREAHNLREEADLLAEIAAVYMVAGEGEQALRALNSARIIYEVLEDPRGEAQMLNNSGVIYQERGEPEQALPMLRLAFTLWGDLGDDEARATTAFNLATVCYQLDDLAEAVRWLEIAVDLHEQAGHPELYRERAALDELRFELELRSSRG
ncbi:MAG: hypothetical protein Kow00124_17340 [Anaerolineae bacterium]